MRLGFLGPAGTFSEAALQAQARAYGWHGIVGVPYPTIPDAVHAAAAREVDRVLVPIENALEGAVNPTLDALVAEAGAVTIVGEAVLAIRTCVVAAREVELGGVAVVVSHPQPLGQCARFLRTELPGAAVRAATSTAEAVREVVAAPGEPWAALAPSAAAELYGAVILREGVDDDPDNATRFVWVASARAGTRAPGQDGGAPAWKTSVAFAGAGDRSPGWLVRCLSEFAFRGVNLTKIESRPRRRGLGHYVFFVDAEGGLAEPAVAEALEGLRAQCEVVTVLGSYPTAG